VIIVSGLPGHRGVVTVQLIGPDNVHILSGDCEWARVRKQYPIKTNKIDNILVIFPFFTLKEFILLKIKTL
jgi:hypothetical protein